MTSNDTASLFSNATCPYQCPAAAHPRDPAGARPEARQQFIEKGLFGGELLAQIEGRLTEARAALRRVLARRQLTLGKDDDACIDACADLATLERWLDQAVTAVSASGALE